MDIILTLGWTGSDTGRVGLDEVSVRNDILLSHDFAFFSMCMRLVAFLCILL